jgi:hypothetical protein
MKFGFALELFCIKVMKKEITIIQKFTKIENDKAIFIFIVRDVHKDDIFNFFDYLS